MNEWIGFILCGKVTTFKKNNWKKKLKTSKSTCLHFFISHFIPVFLFGQLFVSYTSGFIVWQYRCSFWFFYFFFIAISAVTRLASHFASPAFLFSKELYLYISIKV